MKGGELAVDMAKDKWTPWHLHLKIHPRDA